MINTIVTVSYDMFVLVSNEFRGEVIKSHLHVKFKKVNILQEIICVMCSNDMCVLED